MPTFTRHVPEDPRGPAFPILRTPAGRPLTAIITSPDLVGCFTHYFKGRTIPCEGPDCEAHQAGVPYRWHAYQSAYILSTSLHFLFECTAQAASHFTDYREAHQTLRGCEFEARRMNNRPNARILIRCRPAQLQGITLPTPPDLVKCLSILWGFSADDVKDTNYDPQNKTRVVTHKPPKDRPR
jgi:hypothetical protein